MASDIGSTGSVGHTTRRAVADGSHTKTTGSQCLGIGVSVIALALVLAVLILM
ncbi:hypothetical protein [Williamsia sterculiae]|uniref:Uncharacterized protein n=1 Tax=Williamsia sterculiae TaxID=1344003 RepID=A0A1N7H962_9NOCA|nr:hypothetical protein [Williamsia sterculiae]SIS21407.1 hypothetical protein SAMN05445060_3745 [Williamsia sterculiae]